MERNVKAGRLIFTTSYKEAVEGTEFAFIAVGTPSGVDGEADLRHVAAVARAVAAEMTDPLIIINKSTVPVGTCDLVKAEIERQLAQRGADIAFGVASNPEFLCEGSAIDDFMRPDRVVLGVESERAENRLRELYRPLNLIEAPIHVTNLESAELIKYASNAFLATKISFINEMSQLCEKVGADVHSIAKGMGLDGRIGRKFLHAGPGYGGSCFPKDTLALIRIAQEHGSSCRIVESVVEVNAAQKARMVSKIREALGGSEAHKTIAVLGLTFKAGTDDLRESPAVRLGRALLAVLDGDGRIVVRVPLDSPLEAKADECRPLDDQFPGGGGRLVHFGWLSPIRRKWQRDPTCACGNCQTYQGLE